MLTSLHNPLAALKISEEEKEFRMELSKLKLLYNSDHKELAKRYYKMLAKKHHPDKGGSGRKFKEVIDIKNKLGKSPA